MWLPQLLPLSKTTILLSLLSQFSIVTIVMIVSSVIDYCYVVAIELIAATMTSTTSTPSLSQGLGGGWATQQNPFGRRQLATP